MTQCHVYQHVYQMWTLSHYICTTITYPATPSLYISSRVEQRGNSHHISCPTDIPQQILHQQYDQEVISYGYIVHALYIYIPYHLMTLPSFVTDEHIPHPTSVKVLSPISRLFWHSIFNILHCFSLCKLNTSFV